MLLSLAWNSQSSNFCSSVLGTIGTVHTACEHSSNPRDSFVRLVVTCILSNVETGQFTLGHLASRESGLILSALPPKLCSCPQAGVLLWEPLAGMLTGTPL